MDETTTGYVELPVIGAPVSGGGHCIEIELIEHGASGVVKPWQGVAHATPVIHHATPEPPQEIMTMHTSMYHGQESHKM